MLDWVKYSQFKIVAGWTEWCWASIAVIERVYSCYILAGIRSDAERQRIAF